MKKERFILSIMTCMFSFLMGVLVCHYTHQRDYHAACMMSDIIRVQLDNPDGDIEENVSTWMEDENFKLEEYAYAY